MGLPRALAIAVLLASLSCLAHADEAPICPENPVPTYLDIVLEPPIGANSLVSTYVYNISDEDYIKTGLGGATIILVNQTDLSNINLCYGVSNQGGWANFTYDSNLDGCTDYWFIFCPQDITSPTYGALARQMCLNSTGLSQSLIVNPIPKCDPANTLTPNNGLVNFLPSHNQFRQCTQRPKSFAGLCWPILLIAGILLGASQLEGKNPLAAFDFSAQRMGRTRQYSARTQQRSFDFMSIVTAIDKARQVKNKDSKGDKTKGILEIAGGAIAKKLGITKAVGKLSDKSKKGESGGKEGGDDKKKDDGKGGNQNAPERKDASSNSGRPDQVGMVQTAVDPKTQTDGKAIQQATTGTNVGGSTLWGAGEFMGGVRALKALFTDKSAWSLEWRSDDDKEKTKNLPFVKRQIERAKQAQGPALSRVTGTYKNLFSGVRFSKDLSTGQNLLSLLRLIVVMAMIAQQVGMRAGAFGGKGRKIGNKLLTYGGMSQGATNLLNMLISPSSVPILGQLFGESIEGLKLIGENALTGKAQDIASGVQISADGNFASYTDKDGNIVYLKNDGNGNFKKTDDIAAAMQALAAPGVRSNCFLNLATGREATFGEFGASLWQAKNNLELENKTLMFEYRNLMNITSDRLNAAVNAGGKEGLDGAKSLAADIKDGKAVAARDQNGEVVALYGLSDEAKNGIRNGTMNVEVSKDGTVKVVTNDKAATPIQTEGITLADRGAVRSLLSALDIRDNTRSSVADLNKAITKGTADKKIGLLTKAIKDSPAQYEELKFLGERMDLNSKMIETLANQLQNSKVLGRATDVQRRIDAANKSISNLERAKNLIMSLDGATVSVDAKTGKISITLNDGKKVNEHDIRLMCQVLGVQATGLANKIAFEQDGRWIIDHDKIGRASKRISGALKMQGQRLVKYEGILEKLNGGPLQQAQNAIDAANAAFNQLALKRAELAFIHELTTFYREAIESEYKAKKLVEIELKLGELHDIADLASKIASGEAVAKLENGTVAIYVGENSVDVDTVKKLFETLGIDIGSKKAVKKLNAMVGGNAFCVYEKALTKEEMALVESELGFSLGGIRTLEAQSNKLTRAEWASIWSPLRILRHDDEKLRENPLTEREVDFIEARLGFSLGAIRGLDNPKNLALLNMLKSGEAVAKLEDGQVAIYIGEAKVDNKVVEGFLKALGIGVGEDALAKLSDPKMRGVLLALMNGNERRFSESESGAEYLKGVLKGELSEGDAALWCINKARVKLSEKTVYNTLIGWLDAKLEQKPGQGGADEHNNYATLLKLLKETGQPPLEIFGTPIGDFFTAWSESLKTDVQLGFKTWQNGKLLSEIKDAFGKTEAILSNQQSSLNDAIAQLSENKKLGDMRLEIMQTIEFIRSLAKIADDGLRLEELKKQIEMEKGELKVKLAAINVDGASNKKEKKGLIAQQKKLEREIAGLERSLDAVRTKIGLMNATAYLGEMEKALVDGDRDRYLLLKAHYDTEFGFAFSTLTHLSEGERKEKAGELLANANLDATRVKYIDNSSGETKVGYADLTAPGQVSLVVLSGIYLAQLERIEQVFKENENSGVYKRSYLLSEQGTMEENIKKLRDYATAVQTGTVDGSLETVSGNLSRGLEIVAENERQIYSASANAVNERLTSMRLLASPSSYIMNSPLPGALAEARGGGTLRDNVRETFAMSAFAGSAWTPGAYDVGAKLRKVEIEFRLFRRQQDPAIAIATSEPAIIVKPEITPEVVSTTSHGLLLLETQRETYLQRYFATRDSTALDNYVKTQVEIVRKYRQELLENGLNPSGKVAIYIEVPRESGETAHAYNTNLEVEIEKRIRAALGNDAKHVTVLFGEKKTVDANGIISFLESDRGKDIWIEFKQFFRNNLGGPAEARNSGVLGGTDVGKEKPIEQIIGSTLLNQLANARDYSSFMRAMEAFKGKYTGPVYIENSPHWAAVDLYDGSRRTFVGTPEMFDIGTKDKVQRATVNPEYGENAVQMTSQALVTKKGTELRAFTATSFSRTANRLERDFSESPNLSEITDMVGNNGKLYTLRREGEKIMVYEQRTEVREVPFVSTSTIVSEPSELYRGDGEGNAALKLINAISANDAPPELVKIRESVGDWGAFSRELLENRTISDRETLTLEDVRNVVKACNGDATLVRHVEFGGTPSQGNAAYLKTDGKTALEAALESPEIARMIGRNIADKAQRETFIKALRENQSINSAEREYVTANDIANIISTIKEQCGGNYDMARHVTLSDSSEKREKADNSEKLVVYRVEDRLGELRPFVSMNEAHAELGRLVNEFNSLGAKGVGGGDQADAATTSARQTEIAGKILEALGALEETPEIKMLRRSVEDWQAVREAHETINGLVGEFNSPEKTQAERLEIADGILNKIVEIREWGLPAGDFGALETQITDWKASLAPVREQHASLHDGFAKAQRRLKQMERDRDKYA